MYRPQRNVLIIMLTGVAVTVGILAYAWWYTAAVDHPMRACQAQNGDWNSQTHVCRIGPDITCEKNGGWWDPISKSCARVINVPAFTGRPVSGGH